MDEDKHKNVEWNKKRVQAYKKYYEIIEIQIIFDGNNVTARGVVTATIRIISKTESATMVDLPPSPPQLVYDYLELLYYNYVMNSSDRSVDIDSEIQVRKIMTSLNF